MAAAPPSGDLLRPEWLFEVAHRLQACAAPSGDAAALRIETIFDTLPPQTTAEDQLKRRLLERLYADHASWSARRAPVDLTFVNAPSSAPGKKYLSAAVEEARRLLGDEPSTRWTVAALARRVGVNRTDLAIAFRARSNYSLHTYLVLCRVDAAKYLLRTTAWRVEEVARAAGCRSKVSLYGYFRRVMHMTPDTYRRRWTLVDLNDAVRRLLVLL
jgi:transcriptional regulator GlxA family with amidase domain